MKIVITETNYILFSKQIIGECSWSSWGMTEFFCPGSDYLVGADGSIRLPNEQEHIYKMAS